jgi:hypothetical protein
MNIKYIRFNYLTNKYLEMKTSKSTGRSLAIYSALIVIVMFTGIQAAKDTKARIVKINGNDVVVCQVNEISDTINVPLSELIESLEIVKLETIIPALIENAWFTEISDKYICIKTHGAFPARLFDRKGKFICDLGKIGRGPGEYSQLYGLQIDDRNDLIYLSPFATTRKILVYDSKGNRQKEIPLAITQRKFKAFVSDKKIVTVLSMPFKGDSAICFQQTTDGKLLKKIAPAPYMLNGSFDGEVFVNHSTNDFDFYNTAIDTLYHYNTVKNKLEAKFTCDFGTDKKPISILREAPLFYYTGVRSKEGKWNNLLVNKKTLISKYFKIKNDLFGGINSSPVFSNGYFINNMPAITLKNQIKSALKNNKMTEPMRQKLTEMDNSLKIDDNNVILFGKLKLK